MGVHIDTKIKWKFQILVNFEAVADAFDANAYRRSERIRRSNLYAIYGISLVVATFSATFNWALRSALKASPNEYLNVKIFFLINF